MSSAAVIKVTAFCSSNGLHITLYSVKSTSHSVLKKNVFPALFDTKYLPSALKPLKERHPLGKE